MILVKRTAFMLLMALTISCTSDDEPSLNEIENDSPNDVGRQLSVVEQQFVEEYEYVTFNLAPDSFGADRNEKWKSDIKIFLDGSISSEYLDRVKTALADLNVLLNGVLDCYLVNSLQEANVHVIFGEKEAIQEVWPDMFDNIKNVNFLGYALYSSTVHYEIVKGRIWVKNTSIPLFAHELGHVIGLGHASASYCAGNIENNQSFMCSFLKDEPSVFDQAIVRTLYHSKIEAGKTFEQLRTDVEELLLADDILVE